MARRYAVADKKAWAEAAADESDAAVAERAGTTRQTIYTWRKKFGITKSGAERAGRRGRRDVATDSEKRDLAMDCQVRRSEILQVLDDGLAGKLDAATEAQQFKAVDRLLDRGWGTPYKAEAPQVNVAQDTLEAFVAAIVGDD